MTSKPFGVNLTCLPTINPPPYEEYAKVIVDEGVKIVETAGLVEPFVAMFKKAGCIVLHKCTTVRHALAAERKMNVDFLSIDGFECAGHVGETDIPNIVLMSRARQQLKTPFIGSGGFADGHGLAAALSLGACGINMGTRFMCTKEAPVHDNIKQAIVNAKETDTQLVLRRWRNTSRYFRNKCSEAAFDIEQNSSTGKFEEVQPYVSGQRGRQVFLNGDPDYGVSFCCIPFNLLDLECETVADQMSYSRCGRQVFALDSSTMCPRVKNCLRELKRKGQMLCARAWRFTESRRRCRIDRDMNQGIKVAAKTAIHGITSVMEMEEASLAHGLSLICIRHDSLQSLQVCQTLSLNDSKVGEPLSPAQQIYVAIEITFSHHESRVVCNSTLATVLAM